MVPKLRFKEFCGEWEETELKNEVDIIMGQSPSSDSYSEEKIGVPLVQGNADIKNRITFPTRYTNKPTKICKNDSLIMTVRAPVGYIGKANQEVCIGRGVCEIRVKKCNSEYIYQFLINKEDSWNKISQGSTFTSISSNDIKKLKIYIPSLQEQTKIADFLSTVDDKIQNQQDKITHLENIKKGFMQKIFSRKIRFKDEEGEEFPEWEETELKNKVEIIMGQSPSSNSYSEEKIGIPLVQGNADIKNRMTFPTKYTNKPTKLCKKDSIIMTVRAPVGYIGKAKQEVCIGRGVCGIEVKKCNSEYIYQFLMSKEDSWNKISQGSTFTSISSNDIKKLKIQIPSLSEQTKIAAFLSSFDEKISIEKQTLEYLKEIKKGLLQQIFV